jgi:hypothetical protein
LIFFLPTKNASEIKANQPGKPLKEIGTGVKGFIRKTADTLYRRKRREPRENSWIAPALPAGITNSLRFGGGGITGQLFPSPCSSVVSCSSQRLFCFGQPIDFRRS